MSFVTLSAVSILIGIFHIGKFCFWVPFFRKLLLRNNVVDFVEICNICARKAIIEGAKRIINSDEVCHSYSDLNFGVTFFGTQCIMQHPSSVYWCCHLPNTCQSNKLHSVQHVSVQSVDSSLFYVPAFAHSTSYHHHHHHCCCQNNKMSTIYTDSTRSYLVILTSAVAKQPLRAGWHCKHSRVKLLRFTSSDSSANVYSHTHTHKPTCTTT